MILYQNFFVKFCIFTPTEVEMISPPLLFLVNKSLTFSLLQSGLTGNTCHSFNRSDLITKLLEALPSPPKVEIGPLGWWRMVIALNYLA